MKFKKLIAIVLAVTSMMTVSALAVSAASPTSANVTVKVDGKVVDFPDQEPTIVNNRTLVPVRFIAESLGYVPYPQVSKALTNDEEQ